LGRMAHQTDVHVVHQNFRADGSSVKVIDPMCGRVIDSKDSRHIVFRPDETHYFCSTQCKDKFLDPAFKAGKKAA